MTKARLPKPPAEPARHTSMDELAPRFSAAVGRLLVEHRKAGFDPIVYEALRTDERQAWLWGFGRDYDDPDPRGEVTNARNGDLSWHKYGLAVDIISASKGWDATAAFWNALGAAARDEGLAWGGDWRRKDLPHVQWGKPMVVTPSWRAMRLRREGGNPAVWREVHAGG